MRRKESVVTPRSRLILAALVGIGIAGCSVESETAEELEQGGNGGGGGEAACVDPPEPCGDDVDCCEGSLCVMTGDEITCRPECTEDAECETGCCALLLGGGTACLALDYCVVPP